MSTYEQGTGGLGGNNGSVPTGGSAIQGFGKGGDGGNPYIPFIGSPGGCIITYYFLDPSYVIGFNVNNKFSDTLIMLPDVMNIGTNVGENMYGTTANGVSYVETPLKTFTFTRNTAGNTQNRIYFSKPTYFGDNFTICAWVKTSQVGSGTLHYQLMFIVAGEVSFIFNDFGFGVDSDGYLAYGDGKTGGSDITVRTNTKINDNKWYFVSITRTKSNGAVVLYINGVNKGSGTCNSGNTLDSYTQIWIGNGNDGAGVTWGGSIAEVYIYTAVLSATEITNIYNNNASRYGY